MILSQTSMMVILSHKKYFWRPGSFRIYDMEVVTRNKSLFKQVGIVDGIMMQPCNLPQKSLFENLNFNSASTCRWACPSRLVILSQPI